MVMNKVYLKSRRDAKKHLREFYSRWAQTISTIDDFSESKARNTAIALQNYSAKFEEDRLNCDMYIAIYKYHDIGDTKLKPCKINGNREFIRQFALSIKDKADITIIQGKDVTKEFINDN